MVEVIRNYQPFPNEIATKIKQNWANYRELFGLEGQVYFDLLQSGTSESVVNQKLTERRTLVSSLIEDYHKSTK